MISAALLAALAAAAAASPVDAVTVTSKGHPGKATRPLVYGQYVYASGTITVPWRTVYESSAYPGRSQKVCVTPRLWSQGYDGLNRWWYLYSKATHCKWISASATRVAVGGVDFVNLPPFQTFGVDVVVTWRLADGTLIGKKVYDYDSTADYVCVNDGCTIGSNAIGAYMLFDFFTW